MKNNYPARFGFVELLNEAEAEFSKLNEETYKKWTKATPLENDIPVMIATFAARKAKEAFQSGVITDAATKINSDLVNELVALQASYKELADSITILEEDSEPQVGDVVEFFHWYNKRPYYVKVYNINNEFIEYLDKWHETIFSAKRDSVTKILQRAGKPCVYREKV